MRFVGVFILFCLGAASLCLGAEPEENCAYPIHDFWQQVESTPVWDNIVADHPHIAAWRAPLTTLFKVWKTENTPFRLGYSATLRAHGHTYTIWIPARKPETPAMSRLILRIESDPYPKIWGENGETELLNQPFMEFHELYRRNLHEALIVEGRPLRPEVRVSNVGDEEQFRLRATLTGPIDTQHRHLFMMMLERLRRADLVH